MAIDPQNTDAVAITQLDPLVLALETFLVGANADGKMGKFTAQQLAEFIAPYISAIGSSPFVANTGSPLPNPIDKPTAITFVGVGEFDQTTGANVVTTEELNVLFWSSNGATGTWVLGIEVPIDLTDYLKKSDAEDQLFGKVDKSVLFTGDLNMFIKQHIVEGQYVNNSTGITANGTSSTSEPIPVDDSKTYTLSRTVASQTAVFLDESGAQLKPINLDGSPRANYTLEFTTSGQFKPPIGATRFILNTKVTGTELGIDSIYLYEGTGTLTPQKIDEDLIPDLPYLPLDEITIGSIGNGFNPDTMVLDGYFVNVNAGVGMQAAANFKCMYNFPVVGGATYTITGWNSAQTGMSLIKGTNPQPAMSSPDYIASGRVHEIGFPSKVAGAVTITVPEECTFIAITIKSSSETDSVWSTLMVKETDQITEYEPYDPNKVGIVEINGQKLLASAVLNQPTVLVGDLVLLVTDLNAYIRIPFDASYDLVHGWEKTNLNGIYNSIWVRRIANDTVSSEANFLAGDAVHVLGDNISPMMLEEIISVSGNHGIASVKMTATAHGKDASDLFSVWLSNGVQWYLVSIIDVNNLRFFGKRKTGIDGDTIPRSMGLSATHVSGAVHTGTITATTRLTEEMKPAIKSTVVKKIIVDNKEVSAAGLYRGDVIKLVEYRELPDFRDPVLTAPFLYNNMPAMIKQNVVYSYDKTNTLMIEYVSDYVAGRSWHVMREGYTQSVKIAQGIDSTTKNTAYFPNSNIAVANSVSIDFRLPFDLTAPLGGTEDVYFGASVPVDNPLVTIVEDTERPVQRMIQLLKTAGNVSKFGFVHGYPFSLGVTSAGIRKDHAEQWDLRNNTAKSYPRGIYEFTPNGEVLQAFAYCQYFDPKLNPNATSVYWHKEGSEWMLYLDYHSAYSKETVNLPLYLTGLSIELVDSNGGIDLLSGSIVPVSGLIIETTLVNGYAYSVFKLT